MLLLLLLIPILPIKVGGLAFANIFVVVVVFFFFLLLLT